LMLTSRWPTRWKLKSPFSTRRKTDTVATGFHRENGRPSDSPGRSGVGRVLSPPCGISGRSIGDWNCKCSVAHRHLPSFVARTGASGAACLHSRIDVSKSKIRPASECDRSTEDTSRSRAPSPRPPPF
jgi:hypothetical protein